MHLHSGCSGTEPVFPGCQKQAASPTAGKGRCPVSPVHIFIEIHHSLKRKCRKAGNGEEGPNFCPLSQITFSLSLKGVPQVSCSIPLMTFYFSQPFLLKIGSLSYILISNLHLLKKKKRQEVLFWSLKFSLSSQDHTMLLELILFDPIANLAQKLK